MKIETMPVALDYTENEVMDGLINIWGQSSNMIWLWEYINKDDLVRAVNIHHQIYFHEEKDHTLEFIIEQVVILVIHKREYVEMLSLCVEVNK